MLRYKTETRPGLVALYDIRPGNGAGQFLQPRSPHGATDAQTKKATNTYTNRQDRLQYTASLSLARSVTSPCRLNAG